MRTHVYISTVDNSVPYVAVRSVPLPRYKSTRVSIVQLSVRRVIRDVTAGVRFVTYYVSVYKIINMLYSYRRFLTRFRV